MRPERTIDGQLVFCRRYSFDEVKADLVLRDFHAAAPGALWVADITYVPTAEGFLYLAVVLDVFSRKVAGWAMRRHLETELVTSALDMAIARSRPGSRLIHHSDRGTQYTSFAFGHRLREAGILASMGRTGDAYDSALAESCFASLECELLDRSRFVSREAARIAIFATRLPPASTPMRGLVCAALPTSSEILRLAAQAPPPAARVEKKMSALPLRESCQTA